MMISQMLAFKKPVHEEVRKTILLHLDDIVPDAFRDIPATNRLVERVAQQVTAIINGYDCAGEVPPSYLAQRLGASAAALEAKQYGVAAELRALIPKVRELERADLPSDVHGL